MTDNTSLAKTAESESPRMSIRSRSVFTRRTCLLALGAASISKSEDAGADALDFLHGLSEYEKLKGMLPEYMERHAQARVSARKQSLKFSSMEDIARRRHYVREHILQAIGGLPGTYAAESPHRCHR